MGKYLMVYFNYFYVTRYSKFSEDFTLKMHQTGHIATCELY